MDYKETIQNRLKELPEVLRSFIVDEKWRADAERIGKQFNFSEEKYASFENEIFLVLIALEPKNDFEENIKKELELDSNVAGWVTEDVKKSIFDKVTEKLKELVESENIKQNKEIKEPKQSENTEAPEQKEVKEEVQTPKNAGSSFEQIILNQAKAMQPARTSGDGPATPTNLPEENNQPETKPKVVNDYTAGNDPYREPIT